jgi:hypothetical protein
VGREGGLDSAWEALLALEESSEPGFVLVASVELTFTLAEEESAGTEAPEVEVDGEESLGVDKEPERTMGPGSGDSGGTTAGSASATITGPREVAPEFGAWEVSAGVAGAAPGVLTSGTTIGSALVAGASAVVSCAGAAGAPGFGFRFGAAFEPPFGLEPPAPGEFRRVLPATFAAALPGKEGPPPELELLQPARAADISAIAVA